MAHELIHGARSVAHAGAVVALLLAAACDTPATGPAPTAITDASSLRASLHAASASRLEQAEVRASLTVTTEELGNAGSASAGHHADHLELAGVVRHGSGLVDLSAVPALGAQPGERGQPARLLVMETDAGRLHGRRDRMRSGITRSGHAIAFEYDAAKDGGPGQAMRGYLDGELVVSSTQRWTRREGAWALENMTITHFRGGQPVRRTTVAVTLAPLALASGPGTFSPAAVSDVLHGLEGRLLGLVQPTPLFAQDVAGSTDKQSWIDRAGALLTSIVALGAAVIGSAEAALLAAVVGFLSVFIAVDFAYMGTVDRLCADYVMVVADGGEDWFMDFVCFGPGGPYEHMYGY